MSIVKFNTRNRLFPWSNAGLKNLMNYDPFFEYDLLNEDSFIPAMNIKEHKNDVEIEFAAPGFSKNDFDVTIDGDMLNVCAEKEEIEESYTRREFSYNSFNRSMKLPTYVNKDKKVKATYSDGILKLNLLKGAQAKIAPKKKIDIL